MSTEPPSGGAGPHRRGPSVDLDPTGVVTGKSPDRQRRQFLNYAFYRLDPVFRRLPAGEQQAAATAFIDLVRHWESLDDVILRTYSLVGLRADVDFMLWRIAFDPLCFQAMEAAINRSALGAYLSRVHSFLSLQRRSEYVNKTKGAGEGVELLAGQGRFLFVYPFVKTRQWYRLSPHARQGMMDEHIAASAPFKGGLLVPLPEQLLLPLMTDAAGEIAINNIPGGNGPASIYLQCTMVDAGQTLGVGISNVVRVDLLP